MTIGFRSHSLGGETGNERKPGGKQIRFHAETKEIHKETDGEWKRGISRQGNEAREITCPSFPRF